MSFLETEKQEIEKLKTAIKTFIAAKKKRVPKDPVKFCREWLGFEPTEYQLKLIELFQKKQFVAAWWCRQSGKSHVISALLLWFALRNKGCYIAVVGPSWRQTKLIIRRINSFLRKLDKGFYHKPLKTMVRLSNGSLIEAFPNNPETIRGPTLDLIYCVPGYVKVMLSDRSQIPISKLKSGQRVLTYNKSIGEVECRRVLKVFRNPLAGRKLIRVFHDFGHFDCTAEHKIFTLNKGYIPAVQLTTGCKILYHTDIIKSMRRPDVSQVTIRAEIDGTPEAVHLRRPLGRPMRSKTKRKEQKCSPLRKPLIKTSRVRSVQILNSKALREGPATHYSESGMGKGTHKVLDAFSSGVYGNLRSMLSEQKENDFLGVAVQNLFSISAGNLVHGRWQYRKTINHEDQYPQFLERGTADSSGIATKTLESKLNNKTRQERERIFLDVSREGKGQILRFDQTTHNPNHEIQDPSRVEARSMRNMRQTCYTEKGGSFQRKKGSLLKSGMQEDSTSKIMLSSSAKNLCGLREGVYATYRQPNYMQPRMQSYTPTTNEEGLPSTKEVVYDLEVEGNHSFFANGVLVSNCDEMNFIPNDKEMYDAILFTLGTTNGKFVCTSTPWTTDSVFYKICHNKEFDDFGRSHINWEQGLEPKGPLKKSILDKIRKQFEGDPWRWRREMEAEWAEDENVWLPQALITSCIDHTLEYCDFEEPAKGEFYAGLDLGKYQDYSVLAVVKVEDNSIKLIHVHQFPLKTPYASVIGYVKTLCDRWSYINKVYVDMSGVGDYIVEDMINAGITETEGVKFTQPTKEKMASYLKQCMVQKTLKIPYDSDLIAELNIERFELTKDGKIKFNHPENTHDDRFWALALAVAASRHEVEGKPDSFIFFSFKSRFSSFVSCC